MSGALSAVTVTTGTSSIRVRRSARRHLPASSEGSPEPSMVSEMAMLRASMSKTPTSVTAAP